MIKKLVRATAIVILSAIAVAVVFGAGFAYGHVTAFGFSTTEVLPLLGGGTVRVPTDGQGGTPDDLTPKFAPFWEAWALVHQEYVDQPVDDQALAYGAIKGMLGALDHGFAIDGLLEQQLVPPGKTITFSFKTGPAGTFQFYCPVAGHEEAGMVGTLTVAP